MFPKAHNNLDLQKKFYLKKTKDERIACSISLNLDIEI